MRSKRPRAVRMAGWLLGITIGLTAAGAPTDSWEMRVALPARPQLAPVATTAEFAVPVLMYHRIAVLAPDAGPLLRDLTVSPAEFERQVRYLVENGYSILTAGQVERAVRLREELPVRAVALTLDDGYDDNFTQAFPILRRYGLDGTLFLVTSTVDTPGHVRWGEAREMLEEGMEFGSHTVHHFDLTILSLPELDRELRDSREKLERQLETPVRQIAYPSGQYNERVKERARWAGYLAGWKKGGGWVTPESDPLLLPRVRVRGSTTMARFIQKVTHRPASRWELARYDR
jgi:peptidoglycan/xylan/chitin deacetylase (PgdA/CDA1 family)